jgi:hypothetical protein
VATATAGDFQYDVRLPSIPVPPAPRPAEYSRAEDMLLHEVSLAALGRLEAAERYGEPRVIVDVETATGSAEIELPLRVRTLPDGRTEVAGRAYRLWLRVVFERDGGQLDWRLDPGGDDATGRARIIDFLFALAGRGALVFSDPDAGAIAQLRLPGVPLHSDLSAERNFLTDVLVIEAWSGMRLPIPDEPSETDLTGLAQLRSWVEEPMKEARFVGPITGIVTSPPEAADRLHLHQNWRPLLFGLPVRMGRLDYEVRVRYLGAEPLEDGRFRARFEPLEGGLAPVRLVPVKRRNVRDAARAAAGELPTRPVPGPRPRRERLLARARELAESWQLVDPEDDRAREEIRQRWPT